MWQRIQTLYLAIGLGILASFFWTDVASVLEGDVIENISYMQKTIYKVWIIILTVFQFLALGGFKWRMKQFRVVLFTALATLGFQGFLAYDYFTKSAECVFSWTVMLPLVVVVLDLLAARAIMVDEAIVQSASRLRRSRKK